MLDWVSFLPSQGSLGVPRSEMPQIRGEMRDHFLDCLARRQINSAVETVKTRELLPTQDGYSPTKVQKAREYRGVERPILVSSCNHVVDGHHQWMAALIDRPAGEMRVVRIEAPIREVLREAFRVFGVETRQNARDERHSAVWDALASGVIWYAHGVFSGVFSAAISRELRALGARRLVNGFSLAQEELPMVLRGVVAMSMQRSTQLHEAILSTLDRIEENLPLAPAHLDLTVEVDKITSDLQEQLVESVSAEEGLPAPSPVPPGMPETLEEKITVGADRAIRNFSLEATQELRAKVKANLSGGGRTDRLAKIIETEFGVAKRRARFIADQETSLLVSKFREERYKDLGSTEYVWDTSHDEKVRSDHRDLDGKTFSWGNPPITDRSTGARNHPGEDYNCFPSDSPVKLFGHIKKAFRRWYAGELTTIVTSSGATFRATPNHPVLTLGGWKPVSLLDETDEIVEMGEKLGESMKAYRDQRVSSIAEVFESLGKSSLGETFAGESRQFHGDGSYRDVDVVRSAGSLFVHGKSGNAESRRKFRLAQTYSLTTRLGGLFQHLLSLFFRNVLRPFVGSQSQSLAFCEAQAGHAQDIGFRSRSSNDARFSQPALNYDSIASHSTSDRQFALPSLVSVDDRFWVELKAVASLRFTRLLAKTFEPFHGYVYNLETDCGYYATANVVVSNCRCVARPKFNVVRIAA